MTREEQYKELTRVHMDAHADASATKGIERHHDEGVPFENQVSCWIEFQGGDYARGQSIKKIIESLRLDPERAIKELYGAMNYCAIAILKLEKELRGELTCKENHEQTKNS